jgi:NAD(P)-dependent dehydrogenase (short-subunit alcohol dehydrogenase family)
MTFALFTDRARMVVIEARAEAAESGHTAIGTEHILLGMLRLGQGGVAGVTLTEAGVTLEAVRAKVAPPDSQPSSHVDAAVALASIGIDLSAVREAVEASFGKGALRGATSPKFTPEATDVLRNSAAEAHALRHRYIGTEHLLLGLLRERDSLACQTLAGLGVDLSELKHQVRQRVAPEQERLQDSFKRFNDLAGQLRGHGPDEPRLTAARALWATTMKDGRQEETRAVNEAAARFADRLDAASEQMVTALNAVEGLRTLGERQVGHRERRDDPDVDQQSRHELVPKEEDVHTDHHGDQRDHVQHGAYLSSHHLVVAQHQAGVAGRWPGAAVARSHPGQRVRAAAALEGLERVSTEPMDLLDPASIDTFAGRFVATGRPLHILVNSAGIMAAPLARDSRGYESHFATNHLGHFQLTARLWESLSRAVGARVVSVSSIGHRYSPVDFDDPNFSRREYNPQAAYGQSKTANILFAVELDKRGQDAGVRAFSLHPGSIAGTGLERHVPRQELKAAGVIDNDGNPILDPARNLKTVPQGAATIVWCATSPKLAGLGGVYCENSDIAPVLSEQIGETSMADATRLRGVLPYAVDPENAERLWAWSERLLGMKFL